MRGYERYYKIWVKRFHIKNKIDGTEEVLLEEDMPEWLARPAIMVNGKVFTDPKKAKGIVEQMTAQYDKSVQEAKMSQQDAPPPPVIEELTYQDLDRYNYITYGTHLGDKFSVFDEFIKNYCL